MRKEYEYMRTHGEEIERHKTVDISVNIGLSIQDGLGKARKPFHALYCHFEKSTRNRSTGYTQQPLI
jgi:hypothetical protein